MKDIVDRYNSARVEPAPQQMLDDAVAEVVRLRKLVVELETQLGDLVEQLGLYRKSELHKELQRVMEINNSLAERNIELREAVQKFVDYDSATDDDGVTMVLNYTDAIDAARAALKGGK
jgi:hypothetical protein